MGRAVVGARKDVDTAGADHVRHWKSVTDYWRPAYTREILASLPQCGGIAVWLRLPTLEPGRDEVGDGSIAVFMAPGQLVHGKPEVLHVQDQGPVPPHATGAISGSKPNPEHRLRPGGERTNFGVVSNQSQDSVSGGAGTGRRLLVRDAVRGLACGRRRSDLLDNSAEFTTRRNHRRNSFCQSRLRSGFSLHSKLHQAIPLARGCCHRFSSIRVSLPCCCCSIVGGHVTIKSSSMRQVGSRRCH